VRALRLPLLRRLPGLVLLALLSACTTTTTSTSGIVGVDGRDNRAPTPAAGVADPERRAQSRLELASLHFAAGRPQVALDEIRQALAARPDMPEAIGLRALVLSATGDMAGAESSFQRAMELAPADGNIRHNHAWFLCQQRRFAEAEAAFDRTLAIPRYEGAARTLMSRGACQARAGRWLEAERSLSRSYELDPANPAAAYNLAEVLLRRGELERARFYASRINAVPEQVNAESLWLAARIERRLGNLDALQGFGRQLRERFPQSAQTLAFERGRFEE
jgi:type IV pilus assembly protein PilF